MGKVSFRKLSEYEKSSFWGVHRKGNMYVHVMCTWCVRVHVRDECMYVTSACTYTCACSWMHVHVCMHMRVNLHQFLTLIDYSFNNSTVSILEYIWGIWKMLVIVYYIVIAVVGLICNSLVLFSVMRHKTLRKKQYKILISSVVCDLLKVVVIINIIIYSLMGDASNLCEITSVLGTTLFFSSTFHLAIESVNRCFMINSPYTYLHKLHPCCIVVAVLLLWLLPALIIIVLPITMFGKSWKLYMYFEIEMFSCSNTILEEKKEDIYVIAVHVIFLAIPLTIMLVAYSFMLRTSFINAKNIRSVSIKIPKQPTIEETTYSSSIINMVVQTYDTMSPSDYLRFPEIKRRPNSIVSRATMELRRIAKDRRIEIKAAKTIFLIIITFIICNIPIFALSWYDHNNRNHSNKGTRQFLLGVAMWQVCINPVIYFIRLKDFKRVRHTWTDFLIRTLQKILRI